jgi:TPR repeat protein
MSCLRRPLRNLAVPADVANAKPPVDWAHAVEVCSAEVDANPREPRLQYELGRSYFQLKNYPQAVRHYRVAADAGYGQALSDLGIAYVQGFGVIKNDQTAFDLFNKAAAAGNPSGMQNVGSMFGNGFFVKRDQSKALEWYEKSIEAGNAGALGAAGVIYFNGDGGPPDYKVAAQYFQQAADLGDGFSLKFLAILYERGLLGPVDLEKAGALRAKAQMVDPQSQEPNVPPPQGAPAAPVRVGAGGGGNRNGGGGGSDSGCADTQFCTGTVHVNRWHGIATHLPRCWPFCTVQ